MIDRLVALCFPRRGIVMLVFVLAGFYGVYAWTQLPLEAYPDIADVTSQRRSISRHHWVGDLRRLFRIDGSIANSSEANSP